MKIEFRIPFSYSSLDKLKNRSAFLHRFVPYKKDSKLKDLLEDGEIEVSREQYISICLFGALTTFVFTLIISSTIFFILKVSLAFLFALGLAILFSFFVYASRLLYPRVYMSRKQKDIDKNLIIALQDMLVQLNAGIPLFSILVNISSSNYGELSREFSKAVKKINAGYSQLNVLEEIGDKNPSPFFRRALWQISNGMRAGSDISIVIKDSITTLSEEQIVQIQSYGNKLNPAIMFYMLVSVILPALAITFLTIISSLVNLSEFVTRMLFIGMFVSVMIVQFFFLGIIKSIRPSLL